MNIPLDLRCCVATLCALGAVFCDASVARAQSAPAETTLTGGQIVARRALLERAQAAARAGDSAQALALGQQAGAIEMTVSLRMFLAQQYLQLGRHTEAMEQSEYCVREAAARATLERREVITAECRRVSSVSQSRLVLATVVVPSGASNRLVIRIGSRVVQPSEYNLPIAVDPAELELVATAEGVEPHSERFHGQPGGSVTLTVPERFRVVTATTSAATATTASTTTAGTAGTASATTTTTTTTATTATTSGATTNATVTTAAVSTTNRAVVSPPLLPPRAEPGALSRIGAGPWILLATGAASFGASAAFFALREGQFSVCRPVRAEILCDSENAAAQWRMGTIGADSYTYNTLLNATLIGGGVLMAGGLTWLIINVARAPQPAPSPTATVQLHAVVPHASAQSVGIGAVGSF